MEPLLAKAMASAANAMLITDRTGCIVWANEAFARLSGYSLEEAVGQTPRFLQSGKQDGAFYRELWNTVLAGDIWRGEVIDRRKDGSLFTVDEVITPLRGEDGAITHFLAIQHDITSHAQERDRDRYLAYHDALTGLPNRTQFLAALQQFMANATRNNHALALLFLDLDRFKPINDDLGHSAGDQLLRAVAERLSAHVRRSDIVARLGGDEFAILLTGFTNTDAIATLATKLLGAVAETFILDGHTVQITASIGVALYPHDEIDAAALLKNADKAMYEAKRKGRNAYYIYDGKEDAVVT